MADDLLVVLHGGQLQLQVERANLLQRRTGATITGIATRLQQHSTFMFSVIDGPINLFNLFV